MTNGPMELIKLIAIMQKAEIWLRGKRGLNPRSGEGVKRWRGEQGTLSHLLETHGKNYENEVSVNCVYLC